MESAELLLTEVCVQKRVELLICLALLALSDKLSVWPVLVCLILWTRSMLEKTTDTTVRILQQFVGVMLALEGILLWAAIPASRHWLHPVGTGIVAAAIGIFLFWLTPPVLVLNPDDPFGKSSFPFQKLFGVLLVIMGGMRAIAEMFWPKA